MTTTDDATMTDLPFSLDDDAATDPSRAGRKAATLARLRRAGHEVPGGVVLPVAATAAMGEDDDPELLPDATREILTHAIAALGGTVAVRSSAVAEDLPGASWAGQYDSVLGVRTPSELWAAVRRCVASARSLRASAYAQRRGCAPSAIAVLVQRQVDADVAGVAFTANPVTGDDEVLVSAVTGLADRLVAGEVTPEDWTVADAGDRDPRRTGGPEAVLTTSQVAAVAAEARRLAAAIGTPADVEWAIADGRVHVLQARPITALPVAPILDLPTGGTWEKDASHHTEPLSPVGTTLYFPPLGGAVCEMARTYGLLIDGMEQRFPGGESYSRILPPGGKDGPAPPWWLMGILLRVVPPLRAKAQVARSVIADDLPQRTLDRWPREWRPDLERRIAELRGVDLEALDDRGLDAHLDRVCALSADGQRIHFLLFVPYVMALHDLVTATADLLGWSEAQALDLVGGLSTTSSAPDRDLRRIAALAQRDPAVARIVADSAGTPPADVLAALRGAGAAEVADGLTEHLAYYGCRTTGYDPGQPSLAERPELVLGILRDLVAAEATTEGLADDLARRRAEADERLESAASERGLDEPDRRRLHRALERAREAWPVREDNLFFTDSMPCGLMRLAVLEIGRRLADSGDIVRREDACWLEADELRAVLRGGREGLGDLGALVARRRAEHAWVIAHPGPAVIGRPASDPPDLRAAPEAVQRTTGAMLWMIEREYPGERVADTTAVRGTPGSPGRHTGPVRIVRSEDDFAAVQSGDVVVCPITSPVWSVLFSRIGALVTDAGGSLSHAAIVAREHDVPAVLGTVDGTSRLRDGEIVTVDGGAGTVEEHDAGDGVMGG